MSELFKAVLSGICGMLGWGTADFLSASAMKKDKLTEVSASFWLHLFGALFLAATLPLLKYGFGKNLEYPTITLPVIGLLILFALMNFVTYIFFFKALSIGNLSVISSVFSTYAAGTVIVSAIFFGETIPTSQIFALFIIILGIIFLSIQDIKNLKSARGVGWVIPAVIIFSIFFPLWDNLASQGGSPFLVLLIDMIIAMFFAIYAKIKSIKMLFPSKSLRTMLFAGIFNAFAGIAVAWGYETTSMTSIISVISSAVPLTSAFLGYYFLKERLNRIQYLGLGVLIIGGYLLFK